MAVIADYGEMVFDTDGGFRMAGRPDGDIEWLTPELGVIF